MRYSLDYFVLITKCFNLQLLRVDSFVILHARVFYSHETFFKRWQNLPSTSYFSWVNSKHLLHVHNSWAELCHVLLDLFTVFT
jgi:hypothetical protein